MTARTRTAALAAVGALGLVSLAYGIGGAVGGGSASAVGSSSSGSSSTAPAEQQRGFNEDPAHEQGESAVREAAEDNGTARRGPCPHHDGAGFGDGDGDGPGADSGSGTAPGTSSNTAPDPNSY
jgi:hypothetical protein